MFLVSGPELVIATCRAGAIGTFPALNQRTTDGYAQWLDTIKAGLDPESAAFGVNLIVHKTNPRLKADLEVTARHQVPLVITSLGAVQEVVDAVNGYGGLVFHDVTTLAHARKAADKGVDGLILVCASGRPRRNPESLRLRARSASILPWHDRLVGMPVDRSRCGGGDADGRGLRLHGYAIHQHQRESRHRRVPADDHR
jgi:NAD(P)H-dependent flavin oxidoreductase YrpB (nitropropane dioxygenase family)